VGAGEVALRVHVIGTFNVEGFTEHELGSRKARTALRLLAIAARRPVNADRIADVLWAVDQPSDPPGQVAVIMSRLRRVLGPGRIMHGDGGYSLQVDWLDLTAATELLAEAERRFTAGTPAAALAAAVSARELLTHPVLDDDVWLEHERRAVGRLAARARQLVSRVALGAGDIATGVEAAEEAIDADPYDEEALRLAMAGLAAQGRASSALALYERIRAQLADDLGTSPSDETEAAQIAVLKGLPVPGIEAAVRTRAQRLGGVEQLAGRAEELRLLDASFDSVRGGTPRVVIVEGEAGIGKSALVSGWIGGLDRAVRVLEVRCDQLSRVLPLQPALLMLRTFLRGAGASDARELLGADAALLEPVIDWHGTVAPAADTTQLLASSPAGSALLFAALGRVVARACVAPSVLFIDDIQRADPLTPAWIADLARSTDLPLLILLTRRSAEGDIREATQTISLTPLSVDAAAQIVGADRAPELHRRSGGNPLFLSALAGTDPGTELPESIQRAVIDRCAEAGDDAGTLRDAAVLGTIVDVDVLARVLRVDPIPLLGRLETGMRLHLLEERDGSYAFRHEIVREALETSVGSPRRALLHRNAARILSAQADADPMLIAHHARLSGARTIAAEALISASRIAADRFDYSAALGFASEAITAEDSTTARMQRGTVLLRLARYDDARADAEVAVGRGDDLRAYEVAGAIAYYCRDFARAEALGRALLEEAETPEQRAQAHVIQARALHAEGAVRAADEELAAAVRLCTTHRLRRPTSVVAWLKVHMGEPQQAIAALESSTFAGNATLSTIYTPVHGPFIHGYALATLGRAGEALDVLGRAADEARRRGLMRYESLGTNMSAWVYRNIGEVQRAQEYNQVAGDGARVAGYRELEVYSLLDPCDDDLASGDTAAAESRIEAVHALMREPYAYSWRHQLRISLLEGRIALRRGQPDRALAIAMALRTDATTRSAPRYERLGEVVGFEARARLGLEPPDAATLRTISEALATVAGVEAWWLLGSLATALGSSLCVDLATGHRDRVAASLESRMRPDFVAYSDARLERISTRDRIA
jgi:DNA-binding SARP family transcriptional activator/tetratricopeptide (TPR) repeat protein